MSKSLTDLQRELLPIICDGLDPNRNERHAFVAGVIYEKAIRAIEKEARKDESHQL